MSSVPYCKCARRIKSNPVQEKLIYNLILVIEILILKYMQLKIPRGRAMAPSALHCGRPCLIVFE